VRKLGLKVELFHLESFRIIVEKREDGETISEATVKVHVGGSALWKQPKEMVR